MASTAPDIKIALAVGCLTETVGGVEFWLFQDQDIINTFV